MSLLLRQPFDTDWLPEGGEGAARGWASRSRQRLGVAHVTDVLLAVAAVVVTVVPFPSDVRLGPPKNRGGWEASDPLLAIVPPILLEFVEPSDGGQRYPAKRTAIGDWAVTEAPTLGLEVDWLPVANDGRIRPKAFRTQEILPPGLGLDVDFLPVTQDRARLKPLPRGEEVLVPGLGKDVDFLPVTQDRARLKPLPRGEEVVAPALGLSADWLPVTQDRVRTRALPRGEEVVAPSLGLGVDWLPVANEGRIVPRWRPGAESSSPLDGFAVAPPFAGAGWEPVVDGRLRAPRLPRGEEVLPLPLSPAALVANDFFLVENGPRTRRGLPRGEEVLVPSLGLDVDWLPVGNDSRARARVFRTQETLPPGLGLDVDFLPVTQDRARPKTLPRGEEVLVLSLGLDVDFLPVGNDVRARSRALPRGEEVLPPGLGKDVDFLPVTQDRARLKPLPRGEEVLVHAFGATLGHAPTPIDSGRFPARVRRPDSVTVEAPNLGLQLPNPTELPAMYPARRVRRDSSTVEAPPIGFQLSDPGAQLPDKAPLRARRGGGDEILVPNLGRGVEFLPEYFGRLARVATIASDATDVIRVALAPLGQFVSEDQTRWAWPRVQRGASGSENVVAGGTLPNVQVVASQPIGAVTVNTGSAWIGKRLSSRAHKYDAQTFSAAWWLDLNVSTAQLHPVPLLHDRSYDVWVMQAAAGNVTVEMTFADGSRYTQQLTPGAAFWVVETSPIVLIRISGNGKLQVLATSRDLLVL